MFQDVNRDDQVEQAINFAFEAFINQVPTAFRSGDHLGNDLDSRNFMAGATRPIEKLPGAKSDLEDTRRRLAFPPCAVSSHPLKLEYEL
jgi:hypothetical protein